MLANLNRISLYEINIIFKANRNHKKIKAAYSKERLKQIMKTSLNLNYSHYYIFMLITYSVQVPKIYKLSWQRTNTKDLI